MKKKLGSLFTACLMVTVFTMGVFAAGTAKEIKASLRQDATYSLDGTAKTYKDKDGNALYPIEYNGVIYIPAGAVQSISGKSIKWNSKTAKVEITKKEEATSSSSSSTSSDSSASKVKFDGLEITIGKTIKWDEVDNQFSDKDGATVFSVPITVKNTKSETHGLNMFYYNQYGSKGTKLSGVNSLFDDSVNKMGDMRSGAQNKAYIYFLYDGDGDYYVEFSNWSEKVEVKIPVSKP